MNAAYTALRDEIDASTQNKGTQTKLLEPVLPNSRSRRNNFSSQKDRQHWWYSISKSCNRPSPAGSTKVTSPHCSTDYIRRTENVSCCSSALRLLNYYRAKRYFNKLLCVLFSLTIGGLILFFIFPRTIHFELYNFNHTLVRICNYTTGVNVTVENLQTVFSLSNPNYFPVRLKDSKVALGLEDNNMTLSYFYNFELVQKIDDDCEQRSYCTGLASSVENWEWRIAEISKMGLLVLKDSCKAGDVLLQVIVQQYVYQFLGVRKVRIPSVVKKTFSTTCEGCATNRHETNRTLQIMLKS